MTRALVLAGGGAKIGWASGALQVLMDEHDLTFDHIDASSGSVFNLAMLLSGQSATFIADAWGDLSPWEFTSFHKWYKYFTFWKLPSLLTQEAAVNTIIPKWGIDIDRIRSAREVYGQPCVGTFNVCNFTQKRIETLTNDQMDLDMLLAIDAVPGVVPPVEKNGTLYVDAMLLKDANILEAVRRGADEIWVIWTVENRNVWKGGFINHFGHVFEICAYGNLLRELDTVAEMNKRVAAGNALPGERKVTVHLLEPSESLDVDYLYFRNSTQMRPIIEKGRAHTRAYLTKM